MTRRMIDEKENRVNLKKYFKRVFKCKICSKQYGSDKVKKYDNKICPTCSYKIHIPLEDR